MLKRRVLFPLIFLALAGCSIWPEHKPKPEYALKGPVEVNMTVAPSGKTILVDVPDADASLNSQKIVVQKPAYRRDYYADSQWTDKLPNLFQDILVQSLEDAGKFKSVGRPSDGLVADYILQSELRDFAAHYQANVEAPTVVINAHVRLMDMNERGVKASRTFSMTHKAPDNTLESVVLTFNQQTQDLVLQIITWALEESQTPKPE